MEVRFTVALAAVLSLAADLSGVAPFRAPAPATEGVSSSVSSPADGGISATGAEDQASSSLSKELQPQSRLLLIRYVDGEFAKAVQPVPGGKHGFKVPVGKPIDKQTLSDALRLYGTGVNQGDTVQITSLEFRSREIIVRINGGGKKPFHLREHLQVGVGNMSTPPPTYTQPVQPLGATLILEYGRAIPDMSPDDLKHDLEVFLDFSKQRSAAVNWVETLPPQFQQAIRDHQAVVGMDSEMVLAAMGRPDHKVRERDPEGEETEDWIYGTPPSKTTFVTFVGDNVIRVKEFN
ncbi:MAG: hypothetical protein ABSE45_13380 [Candidatus Acidiferrales bacterium]|jgi:hypothetical protein